MTQPKHAKDHPWNTTRWKGLTRPYTHADVERLAGTVHIEYTLARSGAEKFWKLLCSESYIPSLGAPNGDQAVEMAEAGLKAVYLGSCQLAADRGLPATRSISAAVREVNHALLQADRNSHIVGHPRFDWMLPVVADGESGSGGSHDAFESTKAMIEAGAAAVHFNDHLPLARTCGSVTGKVLIPTEEAIQKLVAARLAADTMGVPTVIIARTDADSAGLLSNDHDARDQRFLNGERSAEGFHVYRGGMQAAIARALALAPYADLLWCESSELSVHEARQFAHAVHARFPGKMLAYHCSPSFHWRAKLNEEDIACFQRDLAAMGYRFQFITLAGYHAHDLSMYQFAKDYVHSGMTAYSQIQQMELGMAELLGHAKLEHARFTGTGFSNAVAAAITRGHKSSHAHFKPADAGSLEVETWDYNDGEATERVPMPHLYLLLEPTLPSNAAND